MKRLLTAMGLALLLAACGLGPSDTNRGESHEAEEHEEGEGIPEFTTIPAETAERVGIRAAQAGPDTIAEDHEVQGVLAPLDGRSAQVSARFPGPIQSVAVQLGDRVRRGQVLATVESNLSLTTYSVTAPIDGVVMARQAVVGLVAPEGAPMFEIADLSSLWVDLHIFGSNVQQVSRGAPVTVSRLSDGTQATTTLERILPGTATASQSAVARATIANSDGLWRPGSIVKARIVVDRQQVGLAIPLTALQTAGDEDVVYVQQGDTYRVRPVKLGRRDAQRVEVLEGLEPGELVVVAQSFLIKADLEKSTVEDDD